MAQQALLIASATTQAVLVGFLPAIFWLWFWLREDPHPEPRRVLMAAFLGGMLVVPIAMFLEQMVFRASISLGLISTGSISAFILFVWAGIEEGLKYYAAKHTALKLKYFDEPIDAPIYLITAAVGFASLENIFFLFKTFWTTPELGLATGEMRFMGATLLHIVTSAIVGASIAFSFFHKEKMARNAFFGVLTATLLHGLFNLFIINKGSDGIFQVFAFVWICGIVLLLFLEKIKKINQ